jgi:WD40 repeat protein
VHKCRDRKSSRTLIKHELYKNAQYTLLLLKSRHLEFLQQVLPQLEPSTRMTEKAVHPIIRSSVPVREFDDLGEVASVAVFPDRRRTATNSSDGMLRIWDSKNNAMLMELEGRGDAMLDMALSRDGQLIASSDNEGYVIAWHADTGRPLTQAFRPYPSGICFLDISPDGATLATGSRTTKLWSTETWQLQGESLNYSGTVTCIRYSPSGELLAMATHDYNIHIWNPATKQYVAHLGQGVPSVSLAWTPDGTRLLTGDRDGPTIQEWDLSTGKQVGNIWKGQTGYPWQLAMNRDGTVVASPTTNNRIRLWWVSDRRTIAIFQHTDFPCCITFSVDGKHILAGGKDKKISEWAVPEHAWPKDAPKDQASHQVLCSFSTNSSPHPFGAKAQVFETKVEDSNTKTQSSVTEDHGSDTKDKDSITKACFHP